MSALTGVVRLDGGCASRSALAAALAALSARARGATRIWLNDGAGLAGDAVELHAPQAMGVTEPGFVIASDARLYNRDDLAVALGMSPAQSDNAFILAAYRKWGEDCPSHLIGDFAFAIWDSARAELFCARDHAGVRPFFYALRPHEIVFGSEQKGVLAFGGGQEIRPDRIADFLAGLVPPAQATWHSDVVRLPPGHSLQVRGGQVAVKSYWRPAAPERFRKPDAADAFAELFTEAVRCRTSGAAGAMLSGGLDSSSIALTASRLSGQPLKTFSMVFDSCADERTQIDSVLRSGAFKETFVSTDRRGPFDDFQKILIEQDGLFLAPGLAGVRDLYAAAARSGAGALLDGHGGDEVVSHGFGWLKELALAGRWPTLWRNIRAEADIYGAGRAGLFFTYWSHFGPARKAIGQLHGLGGRIERRAQRAVRQAAPPPAWRRFIDPSLAQETGLDSRWRAEMASRNAYTTEAGQHVAMLNAPIQPHALEVLDHASAHAGIEARYPLWDKRLIEFCLSLPPEEKLRDGVSRYVFRRSMEGVLPPGVQSRRDKFDFAPSLAVSMCRHNTALLDDIFLPETTVLDGFAALPALRQAYARMKDRPANARGSDVQAIWRSAALALWLQSEKDRRVGEPHPAKTTPAIEEAACA